MKQIGSLVLVSLMVQLSITTHVANAQTVPRDPGEAAAALEEIVVTGSRLPLTSETTPAPVLTISEEYLEQSGNDNLAKILVELGPVSPGLSENNAQNFYAMAGMNLVNLRNLGYARTLVLVNGKRQVPGDIYSNAVDLNAIPVPLIERVEIVTGGASAVYGADAVSGVVNVIMKKDFEGVEARLRAGTSVEGDGESVGLTLTAGQNFSNDRGNIVVSALYDDIKGVKATERDYASDNLYTIDNPAIWLNGETAGPDTPWLVHATDVRYVGPTQLGFIPLGPAGYYSVLSDGSGVRPYDYGELGTDIFGTQIGGDGGDYQQYDNLSLPIERFGLAGNFNFRITDNIDFYTEARYTNSLTSTRWQPVAEWEYGLVNLNVNNPFVPDDIRTIVTQLGSDVFPFGRIYEDFGRRGADNDRTSQEFLLGLRGDLAGFNYEIFGGYGTNAVTSRLVGGRDQDRFLESISVILIDGEPVCSSADARARGCAPLNVFSPSGTPAGIAYSLVEDNFASRQTLQMFGANIAGEILKLPAGPLGVVLGVESRENTIETMPSHATRGCRIQMLCEEPIFGSVDVKEVYGEMRVPILSDMPAFEELTLQAAARYSDYNTTGSDTTWNLGGTWTPITDIKVRFMRSEAARSPSPNTLFLARGQTFLFLTDPCSVENLGQGTAVRQENCAALGIPEEFVANSSSKPVYVGGNPDLKPETGETWTIGLTLTPRFLPNFRATIDWYKIELEDAIAPLSAQTVLYGCYDTPGDPTVNPACAAIDRGSNFELAGVSSSYLNIGRLETSGIDFTLAYDFDLASVFKSAPGSMNITVGGTYLDNLRYWSQSANSETEVILEGRVPTQPGNLGGAPQWQANASFSYSVDKLDITWRARYIDSMYMSTSTLVASPQSSFLWDLPYTGAEYFHDLSLGYKLTADTNLRVNVNNIFDNHPPRRSLVSQGRDRGAFYPNLGTLVSASLTYNF